MRADSSAAVLAACLPVGLCYANDPAPRCAVNCASDIRNERGALDLRVICGDKLITNSLFQCLIGACPQDDYGPAVAHVVLTCSNLGMIIGPLHPVEVQHVNMEKPQYLPTPSTPPSYSTPGDTSQPGSDHLTLAFDISIDVKCNSGSDGLVTVSLPLSASSPPTASPAPPSPVPNPGTGEGEGEGEGEGQGEGENGNGTPSSPIKQTQTTADPTASSSCPPVSTPSNAQGPGNEPAPSHSTVLGQHGDPVVTSATSASQGGADSSSPASTSPCSTTSQDTGGLDPQGHNRSDPSSSSASEPSHQPNGGDGSQTSAISSIILPAPVSSAPASTSSTCSTKDDTKMSVDPIPGLQVSKSAEPATKSQPSPLPSPSSPPAAASSTEPVLPSTNHLAPSSPPSSAEPTDPSSMNPPEYARSESGESNGPSGEQSSSKVSAHETRLPKSSAEPLPQEGHSSSEAQAPSYGQGGLTSPALSSQTDALAVETAEGKPTGKTAEPSEITLWPTAKTNRTTSAVNPTGHSGPSTTSCEFGSKETVAAEHTPLGDAEHEPRGSVMVKIIRPGVPSAETMLMTVWEPVPSAIAAPADAVSNVAQLAIGSSVIVESVTDSGHGAVPSNFPTQSRFVMSPPTTVSFSVPNDDAATETSLPRVALVNSVSKATPDLCIIALLIILVSGVLMN